MINKCWETCQKPFLHYHHLPIIQHRLDVRLKDQFLLFLGLPRHFGGEACLKLGPKDYKAVCFSEQGLCGVGAEVFFGVALVEAEDVGAAHGSALGAGWDGVELLSYRRAVQVICAAFRATHVVKIPMDLIHIPRCTIRPVIPVNVLRYYIPTSP
jgi:hypothetical protein